MVDNDLYLAMREGRIPLDIELVQEGPEWVAKHSNFDLIAEVRHADSGQAQSDLVEQVLELARQGHGAVERSY